MSTRSLPPSLFFYFLFFVFGSVSLFLSFFLLNFEFLRVKRVSCFVCHFIQTSKCHCLYRGLNKRILTKIQDASVAWSPTQWLPWTCRYPWIFLCSNTFWLNFGKLLFWRQIVIILDSVFVVLPLEMWIDMLHNLVDNEIRVWDVPCDGTKEMCWSPNC